MKEIFAYHAYWGKTEIPDWEIATLLASIHFTKKHFGNIHLFTDEQTRELLVKMIDAESKYDSIRVLVEPDFPIDRKHFWSYGKIQAMAEAPIPCISIDTDCIPYAKPEWPKGFSLIGLHYDPTEWSVYKNHLPVFKGFLPHWPLDCVPINCAVLALTSKNLRDFYVKHANEFVKRFSELTLEGYYDDIDTPDAVVFFEQRMITAAALMKGKNYCVLNQRMNDVNFPNPKEYYHLWARKDVYRQSQDSADSLIRGIILKMREHGFGKESNEIFNFWTDQGEQLPERLAVHYGKDPLRPI